MGSVNNPSRPRSARVRISAISNSATTGGAARVRRRLRIGKLRSADLSAWYMMADDRLGTVTAAKGSASAAPCHTQLGHAGEGLGPSWGRETAVTHGQSR
jgi:hypothetical protein